MDKLFDDSEMIVRRFSCDCLFPGHILDIALELSEGKVVQCTLNLYMDGKAPLKWRLKEAWKLLKGQEGSIADFILRPEDILGLIEVLSQVVSTSVEVLNTPTTSATNVPIDIAG